MATRALPDLIARIRVDSTGVDSAMTNLIGSFGRAHLALAGLAGAIGILIVGGKSMIDNARAFEDAQLSLAQALGGSKSKLDAMQVTFDAWIKANQRYVSNQFDAEMALAAFVRAGRNATDAMRLLNDALDISVIKHDDVTSAGTMLTLALAGNSRGLRFLGISTAEYNAIMKDKHLPVLTRQHELMALIESKTKDGRKAQDDLKQSTNELNNKWDELSKHGGAVLLKAEDLIATAANGIYDAFDRWGKDDKMWATISGRLSAIAKWIHDWVIVPLEKINEFLSAYPTTSGSNPGGANPRQPHGRASGGSVLAGEIYTVGETRPESLVMYPGGGGMVIPDGGSRGGSGASMARVEALLQEQNAILRELATQPSTTGVPADLWKAMQGAGLNRLRGFSGA